MNYGLPYKGSKNRIAEWVVSILPPASTLCDLFCGGCAVTHAAMLSGKYERFVINDIDRIMPEAFKKAIAGGFADERRVIDRETFNRLKHEDPYVSMCYSFGNNNKYYLWAKEKEELKLLSCMMIMADTWQERRQYYRQFILCLKREMKSMPISEKFPRLEYVQCLECLERMQSVAGLQGEVEAYGGDYRDVPIPDDAVIYCDIPYRGAHAYRNAFDHDAFYDWAERCACPVFISEYSMPEGRFKCIAERKKISSYAAFNNRKETVEKIFIPAHQEYSPQEGSLF